ncbi:MAG: hypothetical protein ACOY94_12600 [Bacillota bacterium]
MEPRAPGHPRAEPHLWPVVAMGLILAAQVTLLQVGVNRLSWGLYREVFAPAAATLGLAVLAWLLYRHVDGEG